MSAVKNRHHSFRFVDAIVISLVLLAAWTIAARLRFHDRVETGGGGYLSISYWRLARPLESWQVKYYGCGRGFNRYAKRYGAALFEVDSRWDPSVRNR